MDIVSVFARAVERHGDRVFVADTESTVTYREADVRTDAVAAELEAHGVALGDTVTLSASEPLENSGSQSTGRASRFCGWFLFRVKTGETTPGI